MYGFVVIWKKKDVNDSSNNESFTKRIKEFSWARIDDPCIWCIQSYKSSGEIRKILMNYIGKGDQLYVFRFDGFSTWCSTEINDWLNKCELD